MTDQEKFNAELQMKTNLQEAKFNMLVAELKEQRQDIRDLNKKMEANQKEFMQQLHNNFVQTMIGVGAIMVAVGGLIIAVLK